MHGKLWDGSDLLACYYCYYCYSSNYCYTAVCIEQLLACLLGCAPDPASHPPATERASSVPTVVLASSGVNTMWLRWLMTWQAVQCSGSTVQRQCTMMGCSGDSMPDRTA